MQDMRSVPYEGLYTKCVRVVKTFRSLVKYYYNTTYLSIFTLRARSKLIMIKIVVYRINKSRRYKIVLN